MSRKQASKVIRRAPQAKPRTGDPITDALKACTDAQEHLMRSEALAKKWQDQRREAIRQAFSNGATAKEIADAVKVSQAKVYQLIGSARALKNG
jgi:DNA-directed RNA polymerase specialized sigma subunit